ncbi:unnamed protein product [Sphenostylis stenocarpa]|uniref:PARG catalytic Macro domain-containing protein n=1 Tax=Sphenostylis stenocarpa TaxID=92480 RepID=A0AA86SG65_9FABA|nr:unnamed protein product [Sphenostylis stenocarpa]
MEESEELRSILPFLPLLARSSSLFWPSQAVETLRELGGGRVDSGHHLFRSISLLRNALSLSSQPLSPSTSLGYALFFDELMSGEESRKWFQEVIPALANLLLRLPSLLEAHYQNPRNAMLTTTALRLLDSQQPGIVFLSQAATVCMTKAASTGLPFYFVVLDCDMLAGDGYLNGRHVKHLPMINFDELFAFEVHSVGLIEDQSSEAVEVDFANKYLGGGALGRGCVQEEIRFMVSPELIAGMLFLPAMADNEAIEIVGVERFSSYKGYASSFRFSGDYVDQRKVDTLGRRKTRIVAIDALCSPGRRQYRANFLLRSFDAATSTSMETSEGKFPNHKITNSQIDYHRMDQGNIIGVATGNWGCGAFGGDPVVKTIIQWLAASQALRPFIAYYTFGLEALQSLDEVAHWILSQRWTVGDLWNMLVEYSTNRSKGETHVGFLQWLLPSIHGHGTGMDLSNLA